MHSEHFKCDQYDGGTEILILIDFHEFACNYHIGQGGFITIITIHHLFFICQSTLKWGLCVIQYNIPRKVPGTQ